MLSFKICFRTISPNWYFWKNHLLTIFDVFDEKWHILRKFSFSTKIANFDEIRNFGTKITLNVSGATAGSTSENSATQQALQTETPNGKRFPGAASAGSLLVGNLKHWFKPKLFLWLGCVGPFTHLFPYRKKLFSWNIIYLTLYRTSSRLYSPKTTSSDL